MTRNKRTNQKQRKLIQRNNKDGYLAPPPGYGYPGRPIHRSHTERLRELVTDMALSINIAPAEAESRSEFLTSLESKDAKELVQMFTSSGFRLVKRKELRSVNQPIQASTRVRTSEVAGKGRTTAVFTVNARNS